MSHSSMLAHSCILIVVVNETSSSRMDDPCSRARTSYCLSCKNNDVMHLIQKMTPDEKKGGILTQN